MLKETKRKMIRGKNAIQPDRNNRPAPAVGVDLEPVKNQRDPPALLGGAGGAGEMDVRQGSNAVVDVEPSRCNDLIEGGCGSFETASSLSELEEAINNNVGLRGFNDNNTKIHVFRLCNQRLLEFVMPVHCCEVHTAHVLEEVDGS